MLSFKQFNEANEKSMVLTFGRFNPPTIGHAKLINKVNELAKRNQAQSRLYASQKQDSKKNPLTFQEKIRFLKQMFDIPVSTQRKVRTPFEALEQISKQGFKRVILVVGSDRVREFEKQVRPFVGKTTGDFRLDFSTFEVVSAGQRDPDAEGVSGVSASKMRDFVKADDFDKFKQGLPKKADAKAIFNAVKKGLG